MKCTLVMKIPTFLYETLLEQKDEKSLHVENCNAIWVCFNWFPLPILQEPCMYYEQDENMEYKFYQTLVNSQIEIYIIYRWQFEIFLLLYLSIFWYPCI